MTTILLCTFSAFGQDGTEAAPAPADTTAVPVEPAPPSDPPLAPLMVAQEPEAPEEPVLPPREPLPLLRFEVNVEAGSIANTDPVWDTFGDGGGMPSFGLSGGYRVRDRVAIVGGWHHVRRGAEVQSFGTDTDADFSPELTPFVAAFFGNELSVGAKTDASFDDVFLPFVQAQALVMTGLVRFDDDTSVNDNPGQRSFLSATGGFLLTTGGEFRFPAGSEVQIGVDLELGYAWLGRMSLGDLGRMKPGGFAVRSGVGVRF